MPESEFSLPMLSFRAMGCEMVAVLSAPFNAQSEALLAQVPLWFAHWERIFSRFRTDSELSRVNTHSGELVTVSAEFLTVVQQALAVAEQTGGLLTPLVGQAVVDTGYDRDFAELRAQLNGCGSHTGAAVGNGTIADWRAVICDVQAMRIQIPQDSRLDLGGFVKGWCADEVVRRLGKFAPALMDAGGDIAVSGPMADGHAWPVAIAKPFDESQPDDDLALIAVRHGGVATSGRDYRRWLRNGKVQHHIIDPRTAQAAQTDVVSVSVWASSAWQAEMWAKRLLILGSEQALVQMKNTDALGMIGACLVLENGEVVMNQTFERCLLAPLSISIE